MSEWAMTIKICFSSSFKAQLGHQYKQSGNTDWNMYIISVRIHFSFIYRSRKSMSLSLLSTYVCGNSLHDRQVPTSPVKFTVLNVPKNMASTNFIPPSALSCDVMNLKLTTAFIWIIKMNISDCEQGRRTRMNNRKTNYHSC